MILVAGVVLIFAAYYLGRRHGDQACREEYAEQYRVAIAAQRLREHHRLNAEHAGYMKVDLTPRPILDGETMKVSLN